MANGRQYKSKGSRTGREEGSFIALLHAVVDSDAYRALSHPARSLLIEVARQLKGDNNGRLLLSFKYMKTRGWKSADTLDRAKAELLNSGLIFETCKGGFPNRASWYAITWYALDAHDGYDFGVRQAYRRGAYRDRPKLVASGGSTCSQNTGLAPSGGHLAAA